MPPAHASDIVWTDGSAASRRRPARVDVDPNVVESNLVFLETGANGKIDIASTSSNAEGSRATSTSMSRATSTDPASGHAFDTPQYFPTVVGDTFYNTVGPTGDMISTANDTLGVNNACKGTDPDNIGSDIAILSAQGADPSRLTVTTVNCMTSYGHRAGGTDPGPDGCSWKTGGITRVGRVLYLAVARQIAHVRQATRPSACSLRSTPASSSRPTAGKTWTNPWGTTNATAPRRRTTTSSVATRRCSPGSRSPHRSSSSTGRATPRRPTAADKYLYAVSNDGYTYNGNYLHLGRVPLNQVQNAKAWQYYHGSIGGNGAYWTSSVAGATRVLSAKHSISQPVIQYLPALKKYLLLSFSFIRGDKNFPNPAGEPLHAVPLLHGAEAVGSVDERLLSHGSAQPLVHGRTLPAHPGPAVDLVGPRLAGRLDGPLRPVDRAEVRVHTTPRQPGDVHQR